MRFSPHRKGRIDVLILFRYLTVFKKRIGSCAVQRKINIAEGFTVRKAYCGEKAKGVTG